MAYFFIALGVVLIYLDYLGADHLRNGASLLYDEVWGNPDPFWKWLGAIVMIGLLGYVPEMKPVAEGMLVLVFAVIILAHSGTFHNLVTLV